MRRLSILVAVLVASCASNGDPTSHTERAGIGTAEEVTECLDLCEVCLDGGVDPERCVAELAVCILGDSDEPVRSEPPTCDTVRDVCLDRGFELELCTIVHDDCVAADGEPWPTTEDCAAGVELCLAFGHGEDECAVVDELCEAFGVEPEDDDPAGFPICNEVYEMCLGAGFEEGLCSLVRGDCEASEGEGWPAAEDCRRGYELCLDTGRSDEDCRMVLHVCEGMVDDDPPEPPADPLCEEVYSMCSSAGYPEELCTTFRDDCIASEGEGWPSHDDCLVAYDMCRDGGLDDETCRFVRDTCEGIVDEDPGDPPPADGRCDSVAALCLDWDYSPDLCDEFREDCLASGDMPWPTDADCERAFALCLDTGHDEGRCLTLRDVCRTLDV